MSNKKPLNINFFNILLVCFFTGLFISTLLKVEELKQVTTPKLPLSIGFYKTKLNLNNSLFRERFERELNIAYFDKAQVIMWLKRASRYFPYIERRLREEGLPEDLKYLAVAESALIHDIRSPAGAMGAWQFLRKTGKRYGLRVNRYVDERRNVYLSTEAAIRYFKRLYIQFENWPITLASYNCGMTKIKRLMREQGHKDYFHLQLPVETERYVYRILAIKTILESPIQYGFNLSKNDLYMPETLTVRKITTDETITIQEFAELAKDSVEELLHNNPQFFGKKVPKGSYLVFSTKVQSESSQELSKLPLQKDS